MPRRAKQKEYLALVLGSGEVPEKEMVATIDNFLDGRDACFVLPMVKDKATETVLSLANYATKEDGLSFIAVSTDKDRNSRALKPFIADAYQVEEIKDPKSIVSEMVDLAGKYDEVEVIAIGIWAEPEDPKDPDTIPSDPDLDKFWAKIDELSIPMYSLDAGMKEVKTEEGSTPPSDDDDGDSPGDDEIGGANWEPYTEEELERATLDQLKATLADFKVPELPPRTRSATYIKEILKAQEALLSGDSSSSDDSDDGDEDEAPSRSSSGSTPDVDIDELVKVLSELVEEVVAKTADAIDEKMDEKFAELGDRLQKLLEEMAESTPDDQDDATKPAKEREAEASAGPRRRRF